MKEKTLIEELTRLERSFKTTLEIKAHKGAYAIAMETMVHLPAILDALKDADTARSDS